MPSGPYGACMVCHVCIREGFRGALLHNYPDTNPGRMISMAEPIRVDVDQKVIIPSNVRIRENMVRSMSILYFNVIPQIVFNWSELSFP